MRKRIIVAASAAVLVTVSLLAPPAPMEFRRVSKMNERNPLEST